MLATILMHSVRYSLTSQLLRRAALVPRCIASPAKAVVARWNSSTSVAANEMREGDLIDMDGVLWRVMKREFSRTAMGRAYVQCELRSLQGVKKDLRFRSEDMVEKAVLDTPVKYTVLYTSGDTMSVMNADTFEQTELPLSLLGDKARYVADGIAIYVEAHKGEPAVVNIPSRITVVVTEMDEAGGVAVVTAGYKVRAPKHVKVGDSIVVDTSDGRYISKA